MIRADQIKRALADRHAKDLFLTEVKTGSTWINRDGLLKFDGYAVKRSWSNPCLSGYEVKVSRADFLQDEKWPGYMAHCHRFSFACPAGMISPEELPEEVGLYWYEPETGKVRAKRRPRHRIIEIPNDLMYYILLSRIEEERHPFFTGAREECEAYLADEPARKRLGTAISSKMADRIRDLESQISRATLEIESAQHAYEFRQRATAILNEYGIRVGRYSDGWEHELRESLAGAAHPDLRRHVEQLANITLKMRDLLAPPSIIGERGGE